MRKLLRRRAGTTIPAVAAMAAAVRWCAGRRGSAAAAHGLVDGAVVVGDGLVVTGRLVAVVIEELINVEVVERALAVVAVRGGREGGPW